MILLFLLLIVLRIVGFDLLGFYVFYCSWDEWVGIDRLMKHTEENMRIKLALDEKYGNDKNARKPRGSSKSSNGQIFLFNALTTRINSNRFSPSLFFIA